LTDSNQVILSTHSPLFVDRKNVSSNIIVDSGNVHPAKSVNQIRELLGIKASDNLQHASYVLVVEGKEDVVALSSLLPSLSEKIRKAIDQNLLIIEKIGGASNLSYQLNRLQNTLCLFHVLLDNDDEGRKAQQKALKDGELELANLTFINCAGMNDSEFEDCLDKEIYKKDIEARYGIQLNVPHFKSNKKWSDRMKDVFHCQGKPWDDNIEAQLKSEVAKCVVKKPKSSLNQHKRSSIDALIDSLEKLIK
ncbi:MAG: hypothetical protein MI784_15165, partial [Cytophagales bacterium]|nr:hypothetical protein [Cytophagales bacterium]